jgi:hypothetical protein
MGCRASSDQVKKPFHLPSISAPTGSKQKSLFVFGFRELFYEALHACPINPIKKLTILTDQALDFSHCARRKFEGLLAAQLPRNDLRTCSIHMCPQDRRPRRILEFRSPVN